MKIENIFKKIEKTFTAEFGGSIVVTKEELVNYCNKYWFEDVTVNTCRAYLQYINIYLAEKNIDCKLTVSDFTVKSTKDGLVSKEEVMTYIDILDNEQDKFIIYALFNGIVGKQVEELRTLKVEQVDFKNKKIMLSDGAVDMDDTMMVLAEGAIKQERYDLIKFSEGAMVQSFDFNMSSKYILKNRPTKTNGMGTDAMKYDGFRSRLKTISKCLDNNITPDLLLKSGYAYLVYKEYGTDATYTMIEKIMKEKNIKANIRTVINAYKDIYVK